MKEWVKDKRYKIEKDGIFYNVYFDGVMIGKGIHDMEQAQKCILKHNGKEYPLKSDFVEVNDEK
jgi:hypothetical protein